MRHRAALATALVVLVALAVPASAVPDRGRRITRAERVLPEGFRPAAASLSETARYVVLLRGAGTAVADGDRAAVRAVLRSQGPAIRAVERLGGRVHYRYSRLVNGFSAEMSARAAILMARRPDVRSVSLVGLARPVLETAVPFIGADKAWDRLGATGEGTTVAVIDSGIDYTHADFGGSGSVAEYDANDPTVVEPGTFPTAKVIAGFDLVGDVGYDASDPSSPPPAPDADPLDYTPNGGSHGTHVAGICCGSGVPGQVGRGAAPDAKLMAFKVFDAGSVTTDIIVAAMEMAVDPNGDGDASDAADVINMSLGADYANDPAMNDAIRSAVRAGTAVVVSAGNGGNQPAGGPAYVLGSPASAPAAITVGASIDQFVANVLTVNAPAGVVLPDGGLMVRQDWSGGLISDLAGDVVDARAVDPPDDPSGVPVPADRMLCDATPAGLPFAGKIALVFKGAVSAGDCDGSEKVFRAQQAGAAAVILWNGFGGFPFGLAPGDFADQVTIPAVMVSDLDSEALGAAASPNAPDSYGDGGLNVTLGATPQVIPGFEDRMTDFSSEGPAPVSSRLKPDVTAPGFNIRSALAGSGTDAIELSGTSMSSPMVAGVVALLKELHPEWTPRTIKAALMNQAQIDVAANDGTAPISASVIGAGRVDAFQAARTLDLATPGSVSFRLQGVFDLTTLVRRIRVTNLDTRAHRYTAEPSVRYTDFSRRFASVRISADGETLQDSVTFTVPPGKTRSVWLELTLDPDRVPEWQQQYGWYYFNPNVDGVVEFERTTGRDDTFRVPWHASALASSATGVARSNLDLEGGSRYLAITELGSGLGGADVFVLGEESPDDGLGQADIAAVGARSFAGVVVDGAGRGLPAGTDPLAGLTWLQFLTQTDEPTEPIEFAVQTHGVRSSTEAVEIDVLVDIGADGVVADPAIGADALIIKLPFGAFGTVCLIRLPSTFEACDAAYFADYSNYNTSVTGLAVDATALGLGASTTAFSYGVLACDWTFDVPACDAAGLDPSFPPGAGFDPSFLPAIGFDAVDPPLDYAPKTVGGFFGGPPGPVRVSVGSAGPGDDPSLLVVFPNNAPGNQATVVSTST